MIVEQYNEIRQQQREDALTTAYMAAYWQRVKKMPSLKKLLEDTKPKKLTPQTPEQMFKAVKQLQANLEREEG